MKRIITGCLLLDFVMAAQAGCNIFSSIQSINYGKRSTAIRQTDRGKTTQLADRTVTLVMQYDRDAHIRVQLNTTNISNNEFGSGPDGSLSLIASDTLSGNNNLDSTLTNDKNDNPDSTGTAPTKKGANKRGSSSRLTQSLHFFMFESTFPPINALNQPTQTVSSPFKVLSPVFSETSPTDVSSGPPGTSWSA